MSKEGWNRAGAIAKLKEIVAETEKALGLNKDKEHKADEEFDPFPITQRDLDLAKEFEGPITWDNPITDEEIASAKRDFL